MSTTAACWIGSSRPTAPKSIRPSVPSREDEDVPGVRIGVEEARPAAPGRACERSSSSASAVRSIRRCLELLGVGDGEAVELLLHEQAPRAQLACAPSARGPSTRRRGRAPSLPWRRPRAGSRARRAGSRRTDRASRRTGHPARTSVRRWATLASSASAARSRSIDSSMPGRWTFTTTASPVCSTRQVGLTDRRRGQRLPVELGEHLVDVDDRARPRSDSRGCRRSAPARRGSAAWPARRTRPGGIRSTRVAAICPSLM